MKLSWVSDAGSSDGSCSTGTSSILELSFVFGGTSAAFFSVSFSCTGKQSVSVEGSWAVLAAESCLTCSFLYLFPLNRRNRCKMVWSSWLNFQTVRLIQFSQPKIEILLPFYDLNKLSVFRFYATKSKQFYKLKQTYKRIAHDLICNIFRFWCISVRNDVYPIWIVFEVGMAIIVRTYLKGVILPSDSNSYRLKKSKPVSVKTSVMDTCLLRSSALIMLANGCAKRL